MYVFMRNADDKKTASLEKVPTMKNPEMREM